MRHCRQCPQFTCISALTKSPVFTAVTSSPTFSTTPQNSCPSVTGGLIRPCDHRSHPYICRSVPQIDAVRTRTSTSVGPIVGTTVFSSESPRAACTLRKAFIVFAIRAIREGCSESNRYLVRTSILTRQSRQTRRRSRRRCPIHVRAQHCCAPSPQDHPRLEIPRLTSLSTTTCRSQPNHHPLRIVIAGNIRPPNLVLFSETH